VFIRFSLSLILGILIGNFFQIPFMDWIFGVLIASYLLIFFVLKNDKLLGINAFAIIFSFGYLVINQQNELKEATHFGHQTDYTYYRVVLVSDKKESSVFYGFKAKVYAVLSKNTWKSTTGKIYIDFEKDELSEQLVYGNHLIIRGVPRKIQNLGNPSEFDKEKYFAYQNVFYTQRINSSAFRCIKHFPESIFMDKALIIRNLIDKKLQENFEDKQAYGVATALLLGIKDHLDSDIKTAYSEAGTMHILAVSGLHVGIIYLIFSLLFRKIRFWRFGKLIYPLLVIFLLLFYSFLTGLSPSVLRASIMFSLFVCAESLNRKNNSLNVLAFSAFVLLCFDPYLLFHLGFQFSYLAVLSILLFEKDIRNLYKPKNSIVIFLWQIVSVSLAAQLLVTPLSLYYFHQFPLHFLLSNIVVIPLTTLVLWGIVAAIFVSSIYTFLGFPIFYILNYLILFQNYMIQFLNKIPFVLLQNMYPNMLETFIFYLIILFLVFFIYQKKIGFFYLSVLLACVISVSQIQEYFLQNKQDELWVWNMTRHSAISIHKKNRALLLLDSGINESNKNFHFKNFFGEKGISKQQEFLVGQQIEPLAHRHFDKYDFWVYKQKSFVWIHQKIYKEKIPSANYLIISKNAITNWSKIELLDYDFLIFDASNSRSYIEKMVQKADSLHIDHHVVSKEGAFRVAF